jgi:hypothetical protein
MECKLTITPVLAIYIGIGIDKLKADFRAEVLHFLPINILRSSGDGKQDFWTKAFPFESVATEDSGIVLSGLISNFTHIR